MSEGASLGWVPPTSSLIPFWISELGSASRARQGSQGGAIETGEVLGIRAREMGAHRERLPGSDPPNTNPSPRDSAVPTLLQGVCSSQGTLDVPG